MGLFSLYRLDDPVLALTLFLLCQILARAAFRSSLARSSGVTLVFFFAGMATSADVPSWGDAKYLRGGSCSEPVVGVHEVSPLSCSQYSHTRKFVSTNRVEQTNFPLRKHGRNRWWPLGRALHVKVAARTQDVRALARGCAHAPALLRPFSSPLPNLVSCRLTGCSGGQVLSNLAFFFGDPGAQSPPLTARWPIHAGRTSSLLTRPPCVHSRPGEAARLLGAPRHDVSTPPAL